MLRWLFVLACLPSIAMALTVGLIDSGIDVGDTMLRARLDEQGMREQTLEHPVSGQEVSWWDYNNHQFNQLMSAFVAFYAQQSLGSYYVKTLASQPHLDPWLAAQLPEVRANLMTWLVSAGPVMGPLQENGVMHGTEAARLIVAGLEPGDRLFHFALPVPVLVEMGPDAASTVMAYHRPLRSYFEALSRQMRLTDIRVLQISMGYYMKWFREIVKRASAMGLIPLDQVGEVTPQVLMKVFYAEYARFIDQHPETVFVMETGNHGLDLTLLDHPLHMLKRPNALSVMVLNENGRRSAQANWGTNLIDIGAVGEPVRALAAGVRLVGLPTAAPMVAARLADFARSHPDLESGKDLIEAFLTTETTTKFVYQTAKIPVLNPKQEQQQMLSKSLTDEEDCEFLLSSKQKIKVVRLRKKKVKPDPSDPTP